LPLYRITKRLQRLGIELSHTVMSDWLMQCAELLEDLHRRMIRKVLDSGHVSLTTPRCRRRTMIPPDRERSE
jgi:transposase